MSASESLQSSRSFSGVCSSDDNAVKFLSVDNDDFLCPICWRTISDAFGTRCGHSFCFRCISQHLSVKHDCPKCGLLLTQDQIFPNFLLNKVLSKATKTPAVGPSTSPRPLEELQKSILKNPSLSVSEVDSLLQALVDKKKRLEHDEQEVQVEVLMHFLQNSKKRRQELMLGISREIKCLEADIAAVEMHRKDMMRHKPAVTEDALEPATVPGSSCSSSHTEVASRKRSYQQIAEAPKDPLDYLSTSVSVPESIRKKSGWVQKHMPDLEVVYFEARRPVLDAIQKSALPIPSLSISSGSSSCVEAAADLKCEGAAAPGCSAPVPAASSVSTCMGEPSWRQGGNPNHWLEPRLREFGENLSRMTRYNRFRVLCTIDPVDMFNGSNIVSSIEFDRDLEYFATAGVTRKIKIFEFDESIPNIRYPVHEMSCKSKLSCVAWNSYIKYLLVSSDYEGVVTLWDIQAAQQKSLYEEHEKRVWSVDFSKTDPTLIVSGSDDGRVKIWSTNEKAATTTIEVENRANICSVKFNPSTACNIAVGSADHKVHYYDLRLTRQPLHSFVGHRKAVSYVRFVSSDWLVSSSTDSTLRLWNVNNAECLRTFTGHTNEKNFVGLSGSQDFIVCGSEENCVYVYHRSLNHHLLKHPFSTPHTPSASPATDLAYPDEDPDPTQFISSVCWRTGTNVLLAANSQGTIKILELA